ncbi:MAG: Gfo/Idh/MocA family protein [Promethearchaeota archaeon]
MADRIRVGIIGLGRISSLHLRVYKPENKLNADLVAICDLNKKRRAEVAKAYNIENNNIYSDYRELLNNSEIDAVEILTPHHLHYKMTIDAAKAHKHISLQKVPAMTLSEMDSMIKAAKENNVKFRIFENFRFYDPYIKAFDLINEGVIGTVERVDYRMYGGLSSIESWHVPLSAWKWRISEKSNYKSPNIWDDGYHKHSIIAKFLGEKIDSVLAWQGKQKIKGLISLDTPCVIVYSCKTKYKYGTWNVSIHEFTPMKNLYYACDEIVDIIGSSGHIIVPGCTGSLYEYCEEGGIKAGVHWVGKDGIWHSDTEIDTDWATSFINCSRAFIEGLRNNSDNIELTPKEARYILQIGLAIISSIRNNFREVKLKEIKDGILS